MNPDQPRPRRFHHYYGRTWAWRQKGQPLRRVIILPLVEQISPEPPFLFTEIGGDGTPHVIDCAELHPDNSGAPGITWSPSGVE